MLIICGTILHHHHDYFDCDAPVRSSFDATLKPEIEFYSKETKLFFTVIIVKVGISQQQMEL